MGIIRDTLAAHGTTEKEAPRMESQPDTKPRRTLLDGINSPADVKKLSPEQMKTLAQEIRVYLTQTVAKTGGHLAPSLGVVELTLALHKVYDISRKTS